MKTRKPISLYAIEHGAEMKVERVLNLGLVFAFVLWGFLTGRRNR